jgi:hypothetical protein
MELCSQDYQDGCETTQFWRERNIRWDEIPEEVIGEGPGECALRHNFKKNLDDIMSGKDTRK